MHECNAMQLLETKKKKKKKHKNQGTKNNSHKGKAMKYKDQENKRFRDIESHQLLDEGFQTYFYQEVW